MSPTGYLFLILGALVFTFILELAADLLNLKASKRGIPAEFAGVYDENRYARSQQYLREWARFGSIHGALNLGALLAFVLAGGFGWVDRWAENMAPGSPLIAQGLIFVGCLGLASRLLNLPFQVYGTFVIEQRHGFNRATAGTFVGDQIKGLILAALLGGTLLSALLWFFGTLGSRGWLHGWVAFVAFQAFLMFVAPAWILPLFNRFDPLKDQDLKGAVESMARKEGFQVRGVYTMDGSKRSSKANAFLVGFGRMRRIVLFDTLLEKLDREECLAVLAHEIGHYRRGHIIKFLLLSVISSGILFFLFSLFLDNDELLAAFGLDRPTVHGSMIVFSLIYSPFARLSAVGTNGLSRKFEFEADEFSRDRYGKPESLISALKKLSVDHLSNLTPHRLKILLDYSHPPVLERIAALRSGA